MRDVVGGCEGVVEGEGGEFWGAEVDGRGDESTAGAGGESEQVVFGGCGGAAVMEESGVCQLLEGLRSDSFFFPSFFVETGLKLPRAGNRGDLMVLHCGDDCGVGAEEEGGCEAETDSYSLG